MARIERTSAARNRPKRAARANARATVLGAVRRQQVVDDLDDLLGQHRHAGRRAGPDERLRRFARARGTPARRRCGPGAPVTAPAAGSGSAHRGPMPPRGELGVLGDQLAVEVVDADPAVEGDRLDRRPTSGAEPSNAPTPPGSSTACRPCAARRGRSAAATSATPAAAPAPSSSRSAGTAQVSACTTALTSTHHAAAACVPHGEVIGRRGTRRRVWRSRRGARRCPSTPDRPA